MKIDRLDDVIDTDRESKNSAFCSQTQSPKRFKRRMVIVLVLVVSCCAGGWMQYVRYRDYLPVEQMRAYAVFRLEERPSRVYFELRKTGSDDVYRLSQGKLIRGKFVLAAAIRQPGIAELQLLKQQSHPVEWLFDLTEIDFPTEDRMRVSLRAPRTKESVAIVNAIVDSYLINVVDSANRPRKSRRKALAQIVQDLERKLRLKENAARKLADALNAVDPKLLPLREQLALENLGLLRKHYAEIQFELFRARIELKTLQQAAVDVDDIEIPEVVIEQHLVQEPAIATLEVEVQQLENDLSFLYVPNRNKLQARLDRTRASLELKVAELRPKVRELARQSLLKRGDANEVELRRKVELLEIQEERLRQELESQADQARKLGLESFELESLKREIVQLKKRVASLRAEIKRLDDELPVKPRITILRRAEL